MDVKILVCYHKDSTLISNDVYTPIHVGKKNSNVNLPFIGDDTGDNISELNGLYCELTGLYWGWKNMDADYIGLCHYRRIFCFTSFQDRIAYIKKQSQYLAYRTSYSLCRACENVMGYPNSRTIYDSEQFISISNTFAKDINCYLQQNPNVSAFALKPTKIGNLTNFYFFCMAAGREHVNFIKGVVKNYYPHLFPYLDKTLKSNTLYYANMVIMRKDVLNDYCSFLFDVLNKHYEWCLNSGIVSNKEDKAIARLMGYMGEFLTSTYISYLKSQNSSNVKLLTMVKYEDR